MLPVAWAVKWKKIRPKKSWGIFWGDKKHWAYNTQKVERIPTFFKAVIIVSDFHFSLPMSRWLGLKMARNQCIFRQNYLFGVCTFQDLNIAFVFGLKKPFDQNKRIDRNACQSTQKCRGSPGSKKRPYHHVLVVVSRVIVKSGQCLLSWSLSRQTFGTTETDIRQFDLLANQELHLAIDFSARFWSPDFKMTIIICKKWNVYFLKK